MNVSLMSLDLEDRERLESFAELIGGWFWEMDADLRFSYFSKSVETLTGVAPEWHYGKTREELGAPYSPDPQAWNNHLEKIQHRKPFSDFVFLRRGPDGDNWMSTSGNPIFAEDGRFLGYRGVAKNVSDEIQAKRRVEQLNFALEELNEAFTLWDEDDRLIFVNRAFREINQQFAEFAEIGTKFEDHLRAGLAVGDYPAAKGREEEWFKERMARHRDPKGPFILDRQDDRRIQLNEQRFADGLTTTISLDITRLKRAEDALVAALENSELANRAKSEFLSSMSHELRTPLNAIMGFAQLLEFDTVNPINEGHAAKVGQILVGARHLLDLINDILDLVKIEAGGVKIKPESVAIGKLIDDCIDFIKPSAEENNISIVNRDSGEVQEVFVDRMRLRQIILNLLSNAVKYNSKEGEIRISCEKLQDAKLRLKIADDGDGIPEKLKSQLFTPFSRLGREASDIEGTGIGLSITKNLVELMDGQISFKSVEGQGTEFYVDLPQQPVKTEPIQTENADPTDNLEVERCEETVEPQLLLYIEDNPANVELMRQITGHLDNVDFYTVRTAELGIVLAQRNVPDLILMDINLPGIDGFAALSELRNLDDTKEIPVVAISADGTMENINKGIDAGFENYLVKPFDVGKVMTTIIEILSARDQKAKDRSKIAL